MVSNWDADENEDDGNENEKNVHRLAELGLREIQVIA